MTVTVKNQSGDVVGTGSLGYGSSDAGLGGCSFPFSVKVPSNEASDTVEVAQRGSLTYTYEELVGRGWKVELALR